MADATKKPRPLWEAKKWWVSNRCSSDPRTGQTSGSANTEGVAHIGVNNAPAPPPASPGPGQRLFTEIDRPRADPDATLRRVDAGTGPERSVVSASNAQPRPRPRNLDYNRPRRKILRPPCRSNLTEADERSPVCTKITCDHPPRIRSQCGYGNRDIFQTYIIVGHFSRISRALPQSPESFLFWGVGHFSRNLPAPPYPTRAAC